MLRHKVLKLFSSIKSGNNSDEIPQKLPIFNPQGELIAHLRPITQKTLGNNREIALLARWRKENSFAFPSMFRVTKKGTKTWLGNQLLKNSTRILFFIESEEEKPKLIGHIGLYSFDFQADTCEIDNVVRGEKNYLKGVMTVALKTLLKWTYKELKPKQIYLRVFADNVHAAEFYRKCGFVDFEQIPLKKIVKPSIIIWEEDQTLKTADKYFLKMILNNFKEI